jgi:hypothetical protein
MKKKYISWIESDNLKLHENFNKYKDKHFHKIKEHLPQRSPREAQARWRFYEDPNLDSNQELSQSELDLLIKSVNEKGNKWSLFSDSLFPGKSQNTLKSAYLKYLRSNRAYQKQNQEESNKPILNESLIQHQDPSKSNINDNLDFFHSFDFDEKQILFLLF